MPREFSNRHSRLPFFPEDHQHSDSWWEGRLKNCRLRVFSSFLVDPFHWNFREVPRTSNMHILSHSRYTATCFIANHPSMRHPSHLLLIISITCLRCPQIIFPSHTGCRVSRSIVHPWTFPIENQPGTLAFWEPAELSVTLQLDLF